MKRNLSRFATSTTWACMLVAASSGSMASAQSLPQLPTAPVTPTIDYSTTFSLPAYATAQFSGLPSGLGISNGTTYLAWCVDTSGTLLVPNRTKTPNVFYEDTVSYKLYNTYPDNALPSDAQSPNWSEVNYILNHKGSASVIDIQQALWYLLDGTFVTTDNLPGPIPSKNTLQLLDEAKTWCGTVFPGPGQVIAVLLDIHGLKGPIQDLIIEVKVPDHCWWVGSINGGNGRGYRVYAVNAIHAPSVTMFQVRTETRSGLSKTTLAAEQFAEVNADSLLFSSNASTSHFAS